MKRTRRSGDKESGTAMVEYALLVAVLSLVVYEAVLKYHVTVSAIYERLAAAISTF